MKIIVICGFFCRILTLVFMLTIAQSFSEPYYIYDDRDYELLVQKYLQRANGIIDYPALSRIGALSYMESFWPCLICISAKTFGFLYAGRVINCILSTACIKVIYDIMCLVTQSEKTRLTACGLFAFLPLSVIVCCFPIKDIFLMYAVLKVFFLIEMWHDDKKINIWLFAWSILLLFGISGTRGAIVEFLLIAACLVAFHKFHKKGQPLIILVFLFVFVGGVFLFGNAILNPFKTKVDDYAGVVETGNRIKYIQMRTPWEIYKLPFSYFYASLQPFLLNYFSRIKISVWTYIIGIFNIAIYPIAIGNFLYIFIKKHSFVFWITTTVLMAGISALSLGNSRHYLFCLPYTIINFSLAMETEKKWLKQIVVCGSIAIFILIFCVSL